MRTTTKLFVDFFLGGMLAHIANIGALLLSWLLHRSHKLPPSFRVVAVCKLVGMGSIVQTTPMLESLKRSNPQCRIIFISTIGNKELLSRIPAIDTIIIIDDRTMQSLVVTTISALFKLVFSRVSCYFDLEIYSHFSAILTVLSCAHYRFGYFRRSAGTRNGIYTHLMYFNIKAPVANVYNLLAAVSGCTKFSEKLTPLYPSLHERSSFQTLCHTKKIPDSHRVIAINPNASDLRTERRWSPDKFIELSSRLVQRYKDIVIIFTGSKNEKAYVQKIINAFPLQSANQIYTMAGDLSLGELLALLSTTSLFITNDSGPLHLAASLEIKTIALFGPCSSVQYGDMPEVTNVYKNVYCSPCVHEFIIPPCRGDNACMKAISVEDIEECAFNILEKKPINHHYHSLAYRHSTTGAPLGIVKRDF